MIAVGDSVRIHEQGYLIYCTYFVNTFFRRYNLTENVRNLHNQTNSYYIPHIEPDLICPSGVRVPRITQSTAASKISS